MKKAEITNLTSGKKWYITPCDTIEEARDFLRSVSGSNYEENIKHLTIRIVDGTDK